MNLEQIKQEFRKYNINEFALTRYINFISNTNCESNYEKHHILPKGKSFWPEYKSLKINKWNEKKLSIRQHFIAHKMLVNVFNDPIQKRSMLSALMKMKKCKNMPLKSREYEKLSIELKTLMIVNNPMFDEETRQHHKEKLNEYWNSDVGIQRKREISKRKKGYDNLTAEGKQRLSTLWQGVPKGERTDNHKLNHIQSQSKGKFVTPWGEFWSPNQALEDKGNTDNLSRHLINKKCKSNVDGFKFIPKNQINS